VHEFCPPYLKGSLEAFCLMNTRQMTFTITSYLHVRTEHFVDYNCHNKMQYDMGPVKKLILKKVAISAIYLAKINMIYPSHIYNCHSIWSIETMGCLRGLT